MTRTVAGWIVAALLGASVAAQQPKPRFEVASVKRTDSRTPATAPVPRILPGGRFRADFATVRDLMWFAYGLREHQIVGGPDWVRKDTFEISANANDVAADQIRLMVQSLLEERFKLVAHVERREMQVLALVRARPDGPLGPTLFSVDDCSPATVNELRRKFPEKYPIPMGAGVLSGCSAMGLGSFAVLLSTGGGPPVIDATGLTDNLYFTIRSQFTPFSSPSADPNLPALSTALNEQLGLRLESRRDLVEVLVVDSAQAPTEN